MHPKPYPCIIIIRLKVMKDIPNGQKGNRADGDGHDSHDLFAEAIIIS